MAKKRGKKHRSGPRIGAFAPVIALLIVVGAAGIGYVWQKSQIIELGERIKEYETRFETLQRTNRILRDELAKLEAPDGIRKKLAEHKLQLGLPEPDQILRLREPEIGSEQLTDPVLSYGGEVGDVNGWRGR